MGAKTEKKRRSSQHESPISLSDPINTEEWKCAVVLVKEGSESDTPLTRMFAEESSKNARKQIKGIDFERDIMNFVKNFISGEIGMKYSFLLNFYDIFEEAGEYLKSMNQMPVSLIAKIIKAFIMKLKKDDEQEKIGSKLCYNNPIEVMAKKPLKLPYREEEIGHKEEDREQSKKKKRSKNSATNVVKIKPLTPLKEDTKLLRRGEIVEETIIDDIPDNSFFQLYIALTGFQYPDLVLEMLKNDIPLHGVFCLQSVRSIAQVSSSSLTDLDIFWKEFLELLWKPQLNSYYKDVVFLVYNPSELPQNDKELRSFIFREISFLMYDLSDIKHKLALYLRHMRIWKLEEPLRVIQSLSHELDQLPQECLNIPIIMQNILDTICGEDEEEEGEGEGEGELFYEKISRPNSILTTMPSSPRVFPNTEKSQGSLLPLISTVQFPTPRWDTITDTDEKLSLYNKMLTLDYLYDLDDASEQSTLESKSEITNLCYVKRRRLYCKNLDVAIQYHSLGLLGEFWRYYPADNKDDNSSTNSLTAKLNYPELTLNYFLYIIWISRLEGTTKKNHNDLSANADEISIVSETKFTVTDGSRIALNKTSRPSNFFSPSHLKIISPRIVTSLSAPELRSSPKFSWKDKSFVSDCHIPVKYLRGEPLEAVDNLRNYINENAFSPMKDYNFIEMLNKQDMIQRIEETASNYDVIQHTYSPLTDSIYVVMYNTPTTNDMKRDTYNVLLTTPVGLRDFYNYIIDDEKDWLREQFVMNGYDEKQSECPDTLYNPTPNFRGFTEFDFWLENSIKYLNHEGIIIESDFQNFPSDEANVRKTSEERRSSVIRPKPTIYAEEGEPYKFVGFDFEPGAVQFSEVNTTFRGPDHCSVRASLQERLYGKQLLGIHIQQGGHNLHLYSYVCPTPHLDQPYTCHIEYKNGTILAFSRRVSPNDDMPLEGSNSSLMEDEDFAYDMKISFPHGLTVNTVREYINPYYIKQSYRENSSTVTANEKSRLFLPNGNIIIMMTDNIVKILKPDASITTASLGDLTSSTVDNENNFQELRFHSFTEITPEGYQFSVVNDEVLDTKRYQIFQKNEKEIQETYYNRMDGTSYVITENCSMCVQFADGSKIYTTIEEEDLYIEEELSWSGEDSTANTYTNVQRKFIMEHPNYATTIYDTKFSNCKLIFPYKSEIEIDSHGCYHVRFDPQTELDIDTKSIRMWRYNQKNELIISTTVNLNVFEKNPGNDFYCQTVDYHGKRFIIESNANCYVTENDASINSTHMSTNENVFKDSSQLRRYFVINRDLSGFEIIHTKNVEQEIKKIDSNSIIHGGKLQTSPSTRYFAILKEIKKNSVNNWAVESVTPQTKHSLRELPMRSTYGLCQTWMHPFPKVKPKPVKPEILHGRILLEIYPSDCPDPVIAKDIIKYDLSDFPETKIPLNQDVNMIVEKVTYQDQEILREFYYTGMRERAESNKIKFMGGSKMQKYLQMSKNHTKRRNYLKNCIRHGIVPCYFDSPQGFAPVIINAIIDSIAKIESAKERHISSKNGDNCSAEHSELEYDIEWSTDTNYSDLSYRSNISGKSAPETRKHHLSKKHYSLKSVKSEPNHKFGHSTAMISNDVKFPLENCHFTDEDILTLAKNSSSTDVEPKSDIYQRIS